MAESLSDKLKSLGVQLGGSNLAKPKQRQPAFSVEEVIPGQVTSTPYGETYVVESWFGNDYQHGSVAFHDHLNLQRLSEWGRTPHLSDGDFGQVIFLDTETTGLGVGAGTFAFLVGLGHLSAEGFHLVQLLMRDPREEPAMLALLAQKLSPFPAVVTYNGKGFDIPLLKNRHVINGFSSPFDTLEHLDLLPLARRIWKNRLPSRSLGYLEGQICGVVRTQEEVPGFLIPQIYFDYLSSGDARPLAGVLYHNAMDILSLAALFQHTAHLLDDPLGFAGPEGLDLIAIARLYEELGQYEGAIQLYEYSLQLGLPEPFFLQTLERFADLYRKHGEWDKTLHLWQKATEHHQVTACVELAKFFEHHQRDYLQALQWTEMGLELTGYISGLATRREWIRELQHRRDRLNRKLNGRDAGLARIDGENRD